MRDYRSAWRGIRAIKKPYSEPTPKWGLGFLPMGFWTIWWTPIWHKGRGPYISIGLWFFAIYRGY